MSKLFKRTIAIVLSVVMLFSALSAIGFAEDKTYGPYEYQDITEASGDPDVVASASYGFFQKLMYNVLNDIADVLLHVICGLYVSPSEWKNVREFDDTYYLPGRETYATEAADGNYWSVGYGSHSIIPDDFEPGKYYIGRDLTNRLAKGINDDCLARAIALDDNSGEGLVIFEAIDGLGVTGGDVLQIRENIIRLANKYGIKIAAINVSATHSHSSIDTQGVATEAIYKILTGSIKNLFRIKDDPKLYNAENFKRYYINAATQAIVDAVVDMKPGTLSYAKVDFDNYHFDKRGLIPDENLPDIAAFHFVPNDGTAGIYFADVPCHPTTFSAGEGLFSADYITYMEQRIEEKSGDRFIFVQGPSGQVSAQNTSVDESQLPEEERMGARTRNTGRIFADLVLAGEYEELSPVINAKFTHFMFKPSNLILLLAVQSRLVNDQIYTDNCLPFSANIVLEEGYVELGGRVGLCLFPVELYPEVFCGTDIIPDYASISWEGTDWNYPVPEDLAPREGIDMYAIHLCNNSLGYCLPDNNFAFLGHIIGDEIADETLSLGKHVASAVVTNFKALMDSISE